MPCVTSSNQSFLNYVRKVFIVTFDIERERTVEQTAESLKKFGEAGVLKFLAWAKKYE